MRALSFVASSLLLMAIAFINPALAKDEVNPVQITEWQVPYEDSRPRDPFAQSADSVWFVGQRSHYLARLDVKSGEFEKVDLPDDAGPHNLIVGSDGIVWYAGNLKSYIGRYDPETGEFISIPMPDKAARDPHTLIFDEGERHIWFTVQGGNFVGRLNIADHKVDLIPIPTERARPYGIRMAPDGTIWAVLFGTNKLAEINPDTLVLKEHVLSHEDSRPRRLEIADNGDIYYVDYSRGYLGHYVPQSGEQAEYALPGGDASRPYSSALDDKGRIWLVETGALPNRLIGFDPANQAFMSVTDIPSGAKSVRHMHYLKDDNSLWFGTDANTIGRAILDVE